VLQRAREAYAAIGGRATPFYGIAAALALALPLVVGALTGHAAQGAMIALGAYLVALRAPEGPYGARARNLASAVLVVAVGATIGGNLSGHTWLAVAVVPPVVALGSVFPWIGPTAGLAVLLTAVRPSTGDVLYGGFLELLGGLLASALLLAPWPARRLRPLRGALSEAADAVAGLLDAVAQDVGEQRTEALDEVAVADPGLAAVTRRPDWEEARRAASRALTNARATYGFYRSGRGREEPTRPERLIDALSRIMHETVALHSLMDAARRRPPGREWEMEARVAVAALAARLRLLAGAVAAPDGGPLGDADSAAVRRLGRQIEAIRRAGLAGEEDLVSAALLVQIRRSVERISGGIESARRVVSGGLRIGFGPPRLPTAPQRISVLERFGTAVRTRSPGFRQAMRVLVTAAVAMALAAALHLPHGQWLTITAALGLRATYDETVTHLIQRVGGTVLGSVIAALLLALAPGQLAAALILFVFAVIAFTLRSVNFGYWMLFGTPVFLMLLDFSMPSNWTAAGERIILVVGGGVLAFLATRLLWPTGHAERLPAQLGQLLTVHADLVRATAAVVEGDAERLPHDKVVAAEQAVEAVTDSRNRLENERVPDTERIARLDDVISAARGVRDHLIAVARMARQDVEDVGPAPEILDRVADHLEETHDLLSAPEPADADLPPLRERLDDDFADLDAHLAKLARRRRAEIKEGVSTDEYTPLRHAVLQVSGTRYALRSLRKDVDDLVTQCLAAAPPSPGRRT
jgi:uncharacterized membrane protein YccC